VLADEINRAPAKVQSALLEAMQEKQVTIGDQTFKLEEPFLVLATQNPIEQEGTYPLPEAQVDRFMLKLKIGYPIARRGTADSGLMARTTGTPVRSSGGHAQQILEAREVINDIYMDDKVKDYIVDLVCATRDPDRLQNRGVKDFIQLGASPRATIALTLAAKAYAFLKGRGYVTPQDVKSIGMDVLRHRVAITYEAEAEEKTSETPSSRKF
jgi:MoxR-like ATPase